MPIYEYRCTTNGRVVEVSHRMSERLANWGELCERAGIDPGRTAANASVEKLMSASAVLSHGNTGGTERPCDTGQSCGSRACIPE
jgi:predicted nucleic acid-binding Zn ribbon protein